LACFVAFAVAVPRALRVQETVHEIARSVKSSNEYSVSEKKDILANLKEMNLDAQELESTSESEKIQAKKDLKERLAQLKHEMHEDFSSQSIPKSHKSHNSFEEEEEEAAVKIKSVHNNIIALKDEVAAKKFNPSDKEAANKLIHQLEEGYSSLSHQTTKSGRKEVALSMKKTASKLREYMTKSTSTYHSVASSQPTTHHFEEKKETILSDIQSAEAEYDHKNYDSKTEKKIHHEFEIMKKILNKKSDIHAIKQKLHSHLENIKQIAEKADHSLEFLHRVQDDTQEVIRGLESEHFSASEKREIKQELRSLESEAEKYSKATSSSEKI